MGELVRGVEAMFYMWLYWFGDTAFWPVRNPGPTLAVLALWQGMGVFVARELCLIAGRR